MSKAILLSIKPKWVAKILNGEKTIEVRKKFPKDYCGWVYIYCTKTNEPISTFPALTKNMLGFRNNMCVLFYNEIKDKWEYDGQYTEISGEVVARFWCDNVEHFEYDTCSRDICGYWLDNGQIFKNKGTCLSADELWNYIKGKDGYAIHISKLEIFDEPKELSEFKHYLSRNSRNCITCPAHFWASGFNKNTEPCDNDCLLPLTKAPQNFVFVESDE